MASGDLISRIYSSFRGVDFRGEEINLVRSPDSLNVWRNYKKTEGIETRPGMELLSIVDEYGDNIIGSESTIHGIYFYNDEMILHIDARLYKVVNGVATVLYSAMPEAKGESFIFNNLWYFKDGRYYLQYDGETIRNVYEIAYVPTTTIGRKAGNVSGGTLYEDVNMLSDWRKNSFIGNGKRESRTGYCDFYLDVPELDGAFLLSNSDKYKFLCGITIDGKPIWEKHEDAEGKVTYEPITFEDAEGTYDYSVYFYKNGVAFNTDMKDEDGNQAEIEWDGKLDNRIRIYPAPPAPLTDGQDNVSIMFKKPNADKLKIINCTLLQVFDNRVFFSGNPNFPNMMWHCSLNDPTYCSDLDYYNEGLDFAKVKGMVAGNNALWVFKEPSQANTAIFYHTPTTDLEYGKIYPNAHSSISTGCVGKAINFNDDIVFFSERGMEGISGDITSEQVVAHRSSLVDRLMTEEEGYENMLLEEWEGYLLVFIGKKVYLADSRAMFSNENHGEYEWFMWELAKEITCTRVHKGTLYLGTEGGLYTLTDFDGALTDGGDKPIESYWVTPKDKFKHPQYLKTTNKRGCTVEAVSVIKDGDEILEAGDITVSVKTEKTDFEDVGTFTNIVDYFVCRIKRKKFKDIQLKFSSKKRFTLGSASLECFIGGYIKR